MPSLLRCPSVCPALESEGSANLFEDDWCRQGGRQVAGLSHFLL
jgi:hypothetical protein